MTGGSDRVWYEIWQRQVVGVRVYVGIPATRVRWWVIKAGAEEGRLTFPLVVTSDMFTHSLYTLPPNVNLTITRKYKQNKHFSFHYYQIQNGHKINIDR